MRSLIACSLLFVSTIYGASLDEPTPNTGKIRVLPVDPTPEPEEMSIQILYPKKDEVKTSTPVKGQIRLDGTALGVDSEFDRQNQIYNGREGQSLHIIIDNQPYFWVNEALINSLDDDQEYFDQTAEFEIPFRLEPGMHVIRTFPVRSYHESFKGPGAFASRVFYYKEKKSDPNVDLSKPLLTYHEPQGEYTYRKDQPILLDFYVTNCQLSKDGYKVRLTIDHEDERVLSSWQPFYIYGLGKGVHSIRLELLSPDNKSVPGIFNNVQRTIVLK